LISNPEHFSHEDTLMAKSFVCPVCGFPNLTEEPRHPDGGGSDECCPSCGFNSVTTATTEASVLSSGGATGSGAVCLGRARASSLLPTGARTLNCRTFDENQSTLAAEGAPRVLLDSNVTTGLRHTVPVQRPVRCPDRSKRPLVHAGQIL
jgi:hypothetical protein